MILDLLTYVIFLLIECLLFLFGDVPMILGCHISFFLADLVIFMMKFVSLGFTHGAVVYLSVDATVLTG